MSFRIVDFEHRKALMACFREIQDDGNEYFIVQDDAYGYNADSQCVFIMLESGWEGYSLAVVCPTYSDAKFVVTNDETGEEYHYSTREKLMDEEFLVKPWCYEDNKNAVCGCFEPCRLPDEESDEEESGTTLTCKCGEKYNYWGSRCRDGSYLECTDCFVESDDE